MTLSSMPKTPAKKPSSHARWAGLKGAFSGIKLIGMAYSRRLDGFLIHEIEQFFLGMPVGKLREA
ncbi:MAG: hypothetical protein ACREX9_21660, partial [Gammaproteobacteria bacterium]